MWTGFQDRHPKSAVEDVKENPTISLQLIKQKKVWTPLRKTCLNWTEEADEDEGIGEANNSKKPAALDSSGDAIYIKPPYTLRIKFSYVKHFVVRKIFSWRPA